MDSSNPSCGHFSGDRNGFAETGVKNLEGNQMPTGDLAEYTPSKPMELLSGQDAAKLDEIMSTYNGSGSSLLKNTSKSYYYYENLDPVAKEIYDVMLGVAQDPVSEGNIGLMMTDIDPQSQDYYYEFNVAYRALCFDHPELFWLYSGQEAEMVYLSEQSITGAFILSILKWQSPLSIMRNRCRPLIRQQKLFWQMSTEMPPIMRLSVRSMTNSSHW